MAQTSGVEGVNGVAVAAVAAGAVLVWSGLKGASVSASLKSLINGKAPAGKNINPIGTPSAAVSGTASPANGGSSSAIAATALQYDGRFPYVWDGAPANGSGDCSSFANMVIGWKLGMAIPGFTAGEYKGLTHGPGTLAWLAWPGCVTVGHDGHVAQAGDLAIWQTHMGICLGPNQMISAQDPANGTRVSSIDGVIPELLFIRRLRATTLDVPFSQLAG